MNTSWVPHHNCIRRNIPCDNGTGADHRMSTNLYAGQNGRVRSDGSTRVNYCLQEFFWILLASGKSIIGEGNIRPYKNIAFNGYTIPNLDTTFDRYPIANVYLVFNEHRIADITILAERCPR